MTHSGDETLKVEIVFQNDYYVPVVEEEERHDLSSPGLPEVMREVMCLARELQLPRVEMRMSWK